MLISRDPDIVDHMNNNLLDDISIETKLDSTIETKVDSTMDKPDKMKYPKRNGKSDSMYNMFIQTRLEINYFLEQYYMFDSL